MIKTYACKNIINNSNDIIKNNKNIGKIIIIIFIITNFFSIVANIKLIITNNNTWPENIFANNRIPKVKGLIM